MLKEIHKSRQDLYVCVCVLWVSISCYYDFPVRFWKCSENMFKSEEKNRKRINISVTLVSESYVILCCEKNVICNSSIKICLNQSVLTVTYFYFHFISAFYTFLGNEIVTGNALYRTSHWPCVSSETYIFRATTNDYLSVITRVISLILSIVSFVVFMLLFLCYPLILLALTFFIYCLLVLF